MGWTCVLGDTSERAIERELDDFRQSGFTILEKARMRRDSGQLWQWILAERSGKVVAYVIVAENGASKVMSHLEGPYGPACPKAWLSRITEWGGYANEWKNRVLECAT